MLRSVGVTQDCYLIETEWSLDDYTLDLEASQQIVEWFRERLPMPEVRVRNGVKASRVHGHYDGLKRELVLNSVGENLGTLLHELAHHHQYTRPLAGRRHDKVFHDSHRAILALVGELFLAKYKGQISFGYAV